MTPPRETRWQQGKPNANLKSRGTALLAQCHSHKFDPITLRDYYRFRGFFLQGQPVNVVLSGGGDKTKPARVAGLIEERTALFGRVHQRLLAAERRRRPQEAILIIPKNVIRGMAEDEKKRYDELGKQLAQMPQTWAFYSPLASNPLHVPPLELPWPLPFDPALLGSLQSRLYVRGDIGSPGPEVGTGWPAVFGSPGVPWDDRRPRTALAQWLTSPRNPLTSRVWVNRIWQFHDGRGLVEDSSNFGVQTPRPDHQPLLDWLATELMDSGWSTRHIHRLIVLSETYRRSTAPADESPSIDPDNRFWWRWNTRRLESEAIRDSLLAVVGELDRRTGGPAVAANHASRRSLYLQQRRRQLPEFQQLFDAPPALSSCSRRRVSTVPLQPLFLLNSEFVRLCSRQFASRLDQEVGADPHRQVARAFLLTLGRQPDASELEKSNEFLSGAASAEQRRDRLVDFCHLLLNLNEFLYIP